MNNNAPNPIPEELHVYSHDEGTEIDSTPAGVEKLDGGVFHCYRHFTPLECSISSE